MTTAVAERLAKRFSDDRGEIRGDAVYTLEEIGRRLQLGPHALRQAMKNGMRVKKIGRRKYVYGGDVIAHIRGAAK